MRGFSVELGAGRGAVRLAHLLWEQGVGGSNPLAPTIYNQGGIAPLGT